MLRRLISIRRGREDEGKNFSDPFENDGRIGRRFGASAKPRVLTVHEFVSIPAPPGRTRFRRKLRARYAPTIALLRHKRYFYWGATNRDALIPRSPIFHRPRKYSFFPDAHSWKKKNRERMDEIVPTNLPWSNDFESGAFLSICSESLIASWRVVNFLEERQRWFQVGDIPSINRNFINFFPNRFRILTDFVLQITFLFIFFSHLPYSSNITENNYTLLFSMEKSLQTMRMFITCRLKVSVSTKEGNISRIISKHGFRD